MSEPEHVWIKTEDGYKLDGIYSLDDLDWDYRPPHVLRLRWRNFKARWRHRVTGS